MFRPDAMDKAWTKFVESSVAGNGPKSHWQQLLRSLWMLQIHVVDGNHV